jgi:protein-S-isoprenylcysteine O-methyltransferase Ste14
VGATSLSGGLRRRTEGTIVIARIIRLPPVLFLSFLVVGSMAQARFPLSLGLPSFAVGMAVGSGALIVAAAIASAALWELNKHRTTVEPWQRPTALVTSGVFSFSRNPLYLALLLVLAGIAVMADALWLIIVTALLWLSLDRFIIRTEEEVLKEIFTEEYLAYRSRVRRWV